MKKKACADDEIILAPITLDPGVEGRLFGRNDSAPVHPTTGIEDYRKGRVMRPLRLYLVTEGNRALSSVDVIGVQIGVDCCMRGGWKVSAAVFEEGREDPDLTMPAVNPAIDVEVRVRNVGGLPVTIHGKLVGPSVSFDTFRNDGYLRGL